MAISMGFKRFAIVGFVIALPLSSAFSQSVNFFHQWGGSGSYEGSGGYIMDSYVDFSDTPASGRETFFGTGTGNNVDWDLAFRELQLSNQTTTGYCVEMTANPTNTTPNADLVIWSKGYVGATTSIIINDDYNGNLMPKVRIWVQGTSTTTANALMFIAAYSTSHNADQFHLQFYRLAGKTETSCTTSQGVSPAIPWVKVIGGTWSHG